MSEPLVSIVIPAFNKWEYTFKCLVALLRNTLDVPYETIVVDNASSDETPQGLPQLEGIRVQRNDENLGFAKACNQGAAMAKGKYVLFLNNDTEPLPNWLPPMVAFGEADPSIAMVGSKLLFPDGTLQHAGVGFIYGAPYPISPVHMHYRKPAEASSHALELNAVTAACMMVRLTAFNQVGGFDEQFVNGYEDVDLCLKLREAGLRIVYAPDSVLYHHESVSDGRFKHNTANIELFHRRWLGKFGAFDGDSRVDRWVNDPDPLRPPLSVVITMRNALRWATGCLEQAFDNLGPNDQLIVVDNHSTDPTPQFLNQFAEEHPQVVGLVTLERQATDDQAICAGLKAAKHEVAVVANQHFAMPTGCLDRLAARYRDAVKVEAVTYRAQQNHLAILGAKSWLLSAFGGGGSKRKAAHAPMAVIDDEAPVQVSP